MIVNSIVQTPDAISVVTEAATYTDSIENFVLDFGEDIEPVPQGETRQYRQGEAHCFTDGRNIVAGGPVPWDYGDAVIADIDRIIGAQAIRNPPLPPFDPNSVVGKAAPKSKR